MSQPSTSTRSPRFLEGLAQRASVARRAARRMAKRWLPAPCEVEEDALGSEPTPREGRAIARYRRGGSMPWSSGYAQYKQWFLRRALLDEALLSIFLQCGPLPEGYGWRL